MSAHRSIQTAPAGQPEPVRSTHRAPDVYPPQPVLVDADRALDDAIRILRRKLKKAAKRLAKRDRDLADDLYQEALIYLWHLDPSRFTEAEIGYLRNAAVRRMIRLAKRDAAQRDKLPITVRL